MSDALYERYKDALRRGHVAALRGRLDAALIAYGEAADLVPERPLPHTSMAAILVRLERPEEALAAFGLALERAPRDETALAGRAETLATLGRRVDAADAFDRLADAHEAAGRLPEAGDAVRRALELAESKARRRQLAELVERLREAGTDEATAVAERAEPLLEAAAVIDDAQAEPEPEPLDGVTLAAEAEEHLDLGESEAARERLLAAALAHRRAQQIDAALDAGYLALGIAPADPELHLLLAELYLDRGWRGPATDKLLLLDRLAGLGQEDAVRRRICDLAASRLPDEPRLAALCA